MSHFFNRADVLRDYLTRVVGLETVTWMTDRKHDMQSEFIKATKKKLGLGVISWTSGTTTDREMKPLRIGSRFSIDLFFKPSLRKGLPDGADLTELAAQAIHHWYPVDTPTKHLVRFEVTGLDSVADDIVQVFRISCESVVQFPPLTIQLHPES